MEKDAIVGMIEDKNETWEYVFDKKGKSGMFHFVCCDCKCVHNMAIAIEKNGKIGFACEYDEELSKNEKLK